MKKFGIILFSLIILIGGFAPSSLAATTNCDQVKGQTKVWWDGIELKPGQIGRLIIKKDTSLFKLDGNKRIHSRTLKAGEFYRIYAFKPGLLSVGGGYYVERDTKITYQTPSKKKLDQVKLIQTCSIVKNSRVTFQLNDSNGVDYNVYIVGTNEKRAYGSYYTNSWNFAWAGVAEGDLLYKGNYKIYLQKDGSTVISDTGIKFNDYIYNYSREMIYEIPSYYSGQPDLFAIANTESSNYESAHLYYVSNGKLFRVKDQYEDWPASITYTTRPTSVGPLTFETTDYNNAEGIWYTNTWSFNPNNATFEVIDTTEEYVW